MRRFFVDPENIKGSTAILTGPEARHIATVLRLATDTKVILFDGSGSYYETLLTRIAPSRVEAEIMSITPYIETAEDSRPDLHLAMGLVKGKKMDFIIQKITELGVGGLHPFHSQYCVVRDNAEDRLPRWEKIALEACKQCNRPRPPLISPVKNFKEIVSAAGNESHDLKLFFWENKEGQKSIREIFKSSSKIHSVMSIIGPEGGFSAEEAQMAADGGYEPVTMGSRILRSETAAVAAVAIIQHELGNLA
ncbi:16S rRNA (uracil(1498)-N(3))-methyltransferase [Thermodesulfobacteriota bacterium]